jgi:hypothetical protein
MISKLSPDSPVLDPWAGNFSDLREPLGEVESRSVLASDLSSRLESTPVRLVDADLKRNSISKSSSPPQNERSVITNLIIILIMRIRIWNHLPIQPRNPRLANLIRILLDIRIPRTRRQRIPLRAVVVGSVEVAHPPLLHHQLLAGGLRLLHDRLQFRLGQVVEAVSVDCDHVDGRAGEVGVFLD